MEITQKAIAKALSSQGTHVLSRTDVLCTLLDDMVPGQIEDLQSIKMVYTDEIGHMLSEASQAPFSDKEKYYREIDKYLQDQRGLVESIRTRFINVFRDTFRRKTVEVIKYKDYKPALSILKSRVFLVTILVAASLIAIFCYIPYTKISRAGLYIFCVIALSLAVCYICRQFFESGIVWFILSVIYLVVITYIYANRICAKADMLFETSLSSAWQMTGYAIWVLMVLFSAAVEVLMIYALYNSESIVEWLIYIIISVMLGIAYGYVVLPVLVRFENGLRRNVSGDYSFVGEPLNSPVVIWMIALLTFIIVLLACASKIVERYSHKRMWMLIWIDVSVLGLLIFGICAKAGIVDNSFSSNSLFDMGSMIAVFIAVRLLIIPIKPQPDLKCRFINTDQEIIDSGYDRKVLEIQILSLQEQLNALVKMTRLTDIKVDMAHKALVIPDDKDEGEEELHDFLDFVEKADKLMDEKKEKGEPVNYSELYSRLMKIRNEEREQIFKIMEAKYNDECMDLDDFDDLDHTDDDSDEDEN